LTELGTKLLLDDGITAKGKPLEHHLMVKDNYEAMKFALKAGNEKQLLSSDFLKKLNSLNMAETGLIPEAVRIFCEEFNRQMKSDNKIDILRSSFDAHANLILIHPWQDGNNKDFPVNDEFHATAIRTAIDKGS